MSDNRKNKPVSPHVHISQNAFECFFKKNNDGSVRMYLYKKTPLGQEYCAEEIMISWKLFSKEKDDTVTSVLTFTPTDVQNFKAALK